MTVAIGIFVLVLITVLFHFLSRHDKFEDNITN